MIYNNRIPHYDATKKNGTEQTLHNSGLKKYIMWNMCSEIKMLCNEQRL